jgi:hypothetical protein
MRDKDSSDYENLGWDATRQYQLSGGRRTRPAHFIRPTSWWRRKRFVLLPECRPSYDIGSADVAAWAARNCGY